MGRGTKGPGIPHTEPAWDRWEEGPRVPACHRHYIVCMIATKQSLLLTYMTYTLRCVYTHTQSLLIENAKGCFCYILDEKNGKEVVLSGFQRGPPP